jgi:hypothetical protein
MIRLPFKNHRGEDDDLEGLPPLERIAHQIPRLRAEVRLARRSYRFTVAVLVAAIAAGAFLFWQQHLDDVQACRRANLTREQIADVVDAQTDALISASAPADGVESPQRRESVARYRAGVDPIVRDLRVDRECKGSLNK